jgi:RecA/RadA recombinase
MSKDSDKIIKQVIEETKKKKEKPKEKPRLLTGSTLLDSILGGEKNVYGIQTGVIWNSIGESGGGKTFAACELIAVNKRIYKDKFKYFFDDAEGGNDIDSQKLYGFEIVTEEMREKASDTVEQLHMNIKKFLPTLKKDEIGCYVIDSLDALISNEVKNIIKDREKAFDKGKEFDQGSYFMEKAKYLKQQFFPDIKPLIEKSNCLLIITSQQGDKIGVVFGSKATRAGGKALKFFCHFESWMKEVEKFKVKYKGEERSVGVRNKIKFTKTRNKRPFRECYSTIFFDYGVADLDSNLDYIFNLLTDSGKTSTNFNIEYKDQVFKKKKDLIKYIEDNNFEDEIKQLAIDKWEGVEEAIKIERKRKY